MKTLEGRTAASFTMVVETGNVREFARAKNDPVYGVRRNLQRILRVDSRRHLRAFACPQPVG